MPTEWVYGFAGGLMIGAAAAIYLWINGRIMGASGILGGVLDGSGRATLGERAAFLAGLVLVPGVVATMLATPPQTHAPSALPVLVAGGLLVGIGTRVANGCTSGHGVCGISRLSLRGIVATLIYLVAGALSVIVFEHLLGIV